MIRELDANNKIKTINPKITKTESNYKTERKKLKDKYNKLLDFKPKNEMEARKKEEALKLLTEKINNLHIVEKEKIETIERKRNLDREKRQASIIFNKLLKILTQRQKEMLYKKSDLIGFIKFDNKLLMTKYRNFINKENKDLTFKDITSEQAYNLLDSVIIKK